MRKIGAQSELLACAWLLDKGYEVCRNVGPFGPIDIVAVKDGEILLLDAKTANTGIGGPISDAQRDLDIIPIYVYGNGECEIIFHKKESGKPRGRPPKHHLREYPVKYLGNGPVLGYLSAVG